MPKVLILGAKGTLGQALSEDSGRGDYQVIAWDREEGDITAEDIGAKIMAAKPDIIINATGYNAVDKAEADAGQRKLAYEINAEAPARLALLARDLGAVFVNYSTDYVFSGDKKEGYAEADRTGAVNEYGRSKEEGEIKVAAAGGRYYIIRLSRLFGRSGASARSKKSFVDIMLGKIDEPAVKAVNEETDCPTYAPDLARFTRTLVEEKKPAGIYHGANSGGCTWYEFAREIFKIKKSDVNLIPVSASEFPRPAKRPNFSILINTKMPAQRSWQEALREYLDIKN